MDVNFELLLQRSNQIKNYVKSSLTSADDRTLNWKESPKKWSVLEVVSHLSQVYSKYLDNFERAIQGAPDLGKDESLPKQSTVMGKLSIYTMKPKKRKRRFKMKTFDFFEPVHNPEQTHETVNLYLENKEKFNDLLKLARLKNLRDVKMPTALGEKMKFYVPECFEFILTHEERHVVQIEEVLVKARSEEISKT